MKLPHYENAIVAEAKIVRYLLSESHEDGRHKAAFFMHFGFETDYWTLLRDALLEHCASYEISNILETSHAVHYTIEGELWTPTGRRPKVRTVWALDYDSNTPRFITAYPMKYRG